MAFVEAIADAINEQQDDSTMAEWRRICLAISFVYHAMDSDDAIAWAAHKFRETLDQKFSSMVHTVYQKMMGVVYMIKRLNRTRGIQSNRASTCGVVPDERGCELWC